MSNYPDGYGMPYASNQHSDDGVAEATNTMQAMKNLKADILIALNKAVDYAQLDSVNRYTIGQKRHVEDLDYLADVMMEAALDHFHGDISKAKEILG